MSATALDIRNLSVPLFLFPGHPSCLAVSCLTSGIDVEVYNKDLDRVGGWIELIQQSSIGVTFLCVSSYFLVIVWLKYRSHPSLLELHRQRSPVYRLLLYVSGISTFPQLLASHTSPRSSGDVVRHH